MVANRLSGTERSPNVVKLFQAITDTRFKEVQRLLVNYGVPINCRNEEGDGVLTVALFIDDDAKRSKLFQYLLRRGANSCFVNKENGMCVLSWACSLGRISEVQQIFDNALGNIDLRSPDETGKTPLHHATMSGDVDVVHLVLDHMKKYHLPVDVPDKDGLTPYLYARRLGFNHIADMLNKRGNAAKKQFDSMTFRTGTFWQEEGQKRREIDVYNQQKDWERWARILGRLPSMQRHVKMARKLPPLIQITDESSLKSGEIVNNNSARTPSLSPVNESIASRSTFRSSQKLNFGRLNGRIQAMSPLLANSNNALSSRSLLFNGDSASETENSKSFGATMQLLAEMKGEHVQNFVGSVSVLDDADGVKGQDAGLNPGTNLTAMMDVLSQQSTKAFRQTTKKPPTPPPPVVKSKKKRSKLSSLAIIMGRIGTPRKFKPVRRGKQSAQNSKKPSTTPTNLRRKRNAGSKLSVL
ncbi:uncharacterized protein LOC141903362 [Tubulanus polymorphus]|uniref:uncharacterized protein LOC141903362 n=1 Tax=Tubulanus polymorphus TaxID=672921 RepID=UPI003DA4D38B